MCSRFRVCSHTCIPSRSLFDFRPRRNSQNGVSSSFPGQAPLHSSMNSGKHGARRGLMATCTAVPRPHAQPHRAFQPRRDALAFSSSSQAPPAKRDGWLWGRPWANVNQYFLSSVSVFYLSSVKTVRRISYQLTLKRSWIACISKYRLKDSNNCLYILATDKSNSLWS